MFWKNKTYHESMIEETTKQIEIGHADTENLRELLISTTCTCCFDLVMAYFQKHLRDDDLLSSLFNIALEGEGAGDAPWAAANLITEFPVDLLIKYKYELQKLSEFEWVYLKKPAEEGLAKIKAHNEGATRDATHP